MSIALNVDPLSPVIHSWPSGIQHSPLEGRAGSLQAALVLDLQGEHFETLEMLFGAYLSRVTALDYYVMMYIFLSRTNLYACLVRFINIDLEFRLV